MMADNDYAIIWRGINIAGLPSSMSEAKKNSATYYFTGKTCKFGHVSPRFTGGACIDCYYEKHSSTPFSDELTGNKTFSKVARVAAKMRGEKHYKTFRPCIHGHSLRLVSSNNCVQCDAEKRNERKEKTRDSYLLKKYGLDMAGRDSLADSQKWLCLICDADLKSITMHVDHCHASGNVRGILCSRRNQAIGLLQDDPSIMRRAADYVEVNKEIENVAA